MNGNGRWTYQDCCVNSDAESISAMVDDAKSITLAAFRRQTLDFDDFVRGMGYAVGRERGLHIASDWAVAFYRSTYRGHPCVFMDHSAIEYIWHPTPNAEAQ